MEKDKVGVKSSTEDKIGTALPVDIRSRVEALLSLVSDIRDRMGAFPVLSNLMRDFQELTRSYILLFESKLRENSSLKPQEKWRIRHEMLDKLTTEWHLIYSLAAATELGSSSLGKFQPYVDQAAEDIGLTDARGDFLLIPTFGESFSLVTVGYSSSNVAILNLPVSVIHSPWELSVIWHELAGLKVIKIRDQIETFLEAYATQNNLTRPEKGIEPRRDLISELFERIAKGRSLDEDLTRKVRKFLSGGDGNVPQQDEMWSRDWFEQLYEDACSVFAFGEDFVSILRTILSRQARGLTADRKHPDVQTRLQVARRLLALHKGEAAPPTTPAERLTDDLLWAFMNEKRADQVSALPVAYASPDNMPQVRRELIRQMQVFNEAFGDLEGGTIHEKSFDFGPMFEIGEKASGTQARSVSYAERTALVTGKLTKLFEGSDIAELLRIPFSPSDELDIKDHNHITNSSHETMSIRVHNEDHTVFWFGVSHV